jgi:hypothetical protein
MKTERVNQIGAEETSSGESHVIRQEMMLAYRRAGAGESYVFGIYSEERVTELGLAGYNV